MSVLKKGLIMLTAGRSLPPPQCPPMGHGPVVFPYKPGPPFDPSYVTFTIATRESPQHKPLDPNNLKNVKNKKTIIIIGGWEEHAFSEPSLYFSDLTKAYLNKSDYNIISVHDYQQMNVSLNENIACTEHIDHCIADLIISLYQQNKVSLSNIHIVGHGLGSHIGGGAGSIVFNSLNKKIYRITALELFSSGLEYNMTPKKQLDKTDAKVVDVIHTYTHQSLGSADFFVNPTTRQPPCCGRLDAGRCDYGISIEYFIVTLNSYIKALQCDSVKNFAEDKCSGHETAIFGDNYKGHPKGNFYLYLY
ncbi:hypothetical protein ILUMI_08237 [Ignelater luminosus]|uniref:Lipase domain-containing protein n=1 Tax=Ignelater luminosus TaxID=2038154 RepID=A0A8K0D610_IGNLU|nr:hypothetical protein ILUMI_08237 [Ignelater luminosus]